MYTSLKIFDMLPIYQNNYGDLHRTTVGVTLNDECIRKVFVHDSQCEWCAG